VIREIHVGIDAAIPCHQVTTKRKRSRFEPLTLTNYVAPRGERYAAIPSVSIADCASTAVAINPTVAEEPGLLRPGQAVMVAALSANSVRVKSPRRMKPGARTDLQLIAQRRTLRGEIDRCRVIGLEPICYEAIFSFDHSVEMSDADLARSYGAKVAVVDGDRSRRRYVRVAVPFDGYRAGLLDTPVRIANLGLGGCFVNSTHEQRDRSRLVLKINLPQEGVVTVNAETVYRRPAVGFALRFVDVDAETSARLIRTVEALTLSQGNQLVGAR
jgi:PilZ domain